MISFINKKEVRPVVDALKSALALLPEDSFVESAVAELATFAKLETPVGCLDKALLGATTWVTPCL